MLKAGGRVALDLLYPRRCVGCGSFGELICKRCLATRCVNAIGAGRCPHCSAAWAAAGNCPRCLPLQALDRALAAYEMEGTARQAVLTLKYRYVRALAEPMAAAMRPLGALAPCEAAFAVPLHPSRLRERGFNQAEAILALLGWPRAPGRLRRVRKTRTQVGGTERQRRENVSGAFTYEGPSLAGRDIALVDDVVTTGATANEIATVLREHGARRVTAFAYARKSYAPGGSGRISD